MTTLPDPRALCPSFDDLFHHPTVVPLRHSLDRDVVAHLIRRAIRSLAAEPGSRDAAINRLVAIVCDEAQRFVESPATWLNATGIIVHTHWGNAPLCRAAAAALAAAAGASPTGGPGPRSARCEQLLCALTGAADGMITTQSAASLVLTAAVLAPGRDVLVAARDLIEISAGVRIQDLLAAGGARVVALGSANIVRFSDYERAVTADTGLILKSTQSNYTSHGYVADVPAQALAELAHTHHLPFVHNLGGGSLVPLVPHGLPDTPTLRGALNAGADLVLASADKLIGGPQAGLIAGDAGLIDRLSRAPLARACRVGKLTLAALEATLRVYAVGRAWDEIPTLRLVAAPAVDLRARAKTLQDVLARAAPGLDATTGHDTIACGGAVLPGVALPTWTVSFAHPEVRTSRLAHELLRTGLVTRRRARQIVVDLRSVLPEDDGRIAGLVITVWRRLSAAAVPSANGMLHEPG